MNKFIVCATSLCLLAGCGKHKSTVQSQSAVSKFSTTALPPPPPPADVTPTATDVQGAQTEVQAAQSNVQQVIAAAANIPAAAPAVATLNSADAHLAAALAKLADATDQIATLRQQIQASEESRSKTTEIMQADIKRLQDAASKDATANAKQVAALEKDLDDARNEALQAVQHRLYLLGALMILAGIGSAFASFYFGFGVGGKWAIALSILGVGLVGFAHLLPKLALWAEYSCMGGAVILFGWLAWHMFHHDPVTPGVPAEASK